MSPKESKFLVYLAEFLQKYYWPYGKDNNFKFTLDNFLSECRYDFSYLGELFEEYKYDFLDVTTLKPIFQPYFDHLVLIGFLREINEIVCEEGKVVSKTTYYQRMPITENVTKQIFYHKLR